MADDGFFTVGPPQPVTDSRDLPAVTAEDEAGLVHGADLGDDHPDNRLTDAEVAAVLADLDADEDLPSEAELDDLVAGVDPDDVDAVGFDETDLEALLASDAAQLLGDRPQTGGA
jgi:hypothetical protein